MGKPCAKQGDQIIATDTHMVPAGPSTVPVPMPFVGIIQMQTESTINICGMPAAVQGTKAMNSPPHVSVDGATNQGEIIMGSTGVKFNNKMAARLGDIANTCQFSGPAPLGQIGRAHV